MPKNQSGVSGVEKLTAIYHSSPFLKHNFIFFLGGLGVGALNYLYYPVLGRVMNSEDFGELQAMVSLIMQFSILLSALSLVTVNIVANHTDKAAKNKIVFELEKLALIVTSGLLLLTVIFSPVLQSFLQFHSYLPFIALAIGFVINVPYAFNDAYLRGNLDFTGSSFANIGGSFVKILLSLLLVYMGLRTFGAVTGIVLSQLLALFYIAKRARKLGFSPSFSSSWLKPPDFSLIKTHLKYGLLIFIVSPIIIMQLSVDIIVIKHYFSPAQAGQYAGIAAMARIIYFITGSIASVLFSSVRITQPRQQNRKLLLRSMGLFTLIGGGALTVFSLAPRLVLGLLFPKYLEFANLLPLLSLAIFVISATNLVFIYYMALRQYWIIVAAVLGALITYGLILANHSTIREVVSSLLLGSLAMLAISGLGVVGYKLKRGGNS